MKFASAILCVLILAMTGCAGHAKKQTYVSMTPPAKEVGAPEQVRKQTVKIEETQGKLFQLGTLITGLTNENAPQVKTQALQLLGGVGYDGGPKFTGGVYQDFSDITKNQTNVDKAVVTIVEHTRDLEKENQELKLDDPGRRRLDSAGFWSLIGGAVLIIGSFFITQWLPTWVMHFRMAGIALLMLSGTCYAAAWYLTEIRFVFICLIAAAGLGGLTWAIVYGIRNRNLLTTNIRKIELGKMTGQIVFSDAAGTDKLSVLKANEPPALKAFVDKVQAAMPGVSKKG